MRRRDHEALLSIGSNVDPERWVPHVLDLIERRFERVAVSPAYRSPAVGGTGSYPDFVNLAVRVRTDCPPRALRETCRRLEEACGRRRTADRYAPRSMDLDVVWMGDRVLDLDGWRLPDPQLATEAFVLVPCADVAPEAVHPERHLTLRELARALPADRRDLLVQVEA